MNFELGGKKVYEGRVSMMESSKSLYDNALEGRVNNVEHISEESNSGYSQA